jgi:hypothetical protein
MMKIKFFSSFCSSEHCKTLFEKIWEAGSLDYYGEGRELCITTEDDYTHAIILNTARPKLKNIPRENVFGLAYEPQPYLNLKRSFIAYAKKHIHTYFIGDKGNLPGPFVEHYGYMGHLTPLKTPPLKNKTMSIIISGKADAPGHLYRQELVREILKTDLPVDIFGRGCSAFGHLNDTRIKGEFTEHEPYKNYHFHLCIENFQSNHYFSEKITNALLCQAVPLYLGCKNIERYFPGYYIGLSHDTGKDMQLIADVIKNPDAWKKQIPVDFIKKQLNLIGNIDRTARNSLEIRPATIC